MVSKKKSAVKARIVVVKIRSEIGTHPDVKRTFDLLKLYKKHYCVIISNDKQLLGMVERVKDYVTFGELDESTCLALLSKRGRLAGNVMLTEAYVKEKLKMDLKEFAQNFMQFKNELKDVPGMKGFFRLAPPVKGFERGGIKLGFAQGGVLGYRGKAINDLIKRML